MDIANVESVTVKYKLADGRQAQATFSAEEVDGMVVPLTVRHNRIEGKPAPSVTAAYLQAVVTATADFAGQIARDSAARLGG